MPTVGSRPDINALLDAYAVLGIDHSANPGDVRQAYKKAARQHHPDRHPPGSPAQREATARMAVINAAYQLVRDAPLRHHRVSTRSNPDEPWSDAELDEALRVARNERVFSTVLSVVGVITFSLVVPWLVVSIANQAGMPPQVSYLGATIIYLVGVTAVLRGDVAVFVWYAIRIGDALMKFPWR
jgi:hypothetical protein